MNDEEHRLFALANTASLILFNEHGNPPTLALSQKDLAEQGTSLLKAYKETVVVPAMERIAKSPRPQNDELDTRSYQAKWCEQCRCQVVSTQISDTGNHRRCGNAVEYLPLVVIPVRDFQY